MEVNKKYARAMLAQLEAYIQFVEEHPEFLAGKNSPDAPQRMQELWEELSARLNSLMGPTKTPSVWKENLRNWRKQLKCKARKVRAEIQRTGGGENNAKCLTAFEERALQSLGTVTITGLNGVDLGFGGESEFHVPDAGCESPVEFLESVTILAPISSTSPSPPPLVLLEQPSTPTLNAPATTPSAPRTTATPARKRSHRKTPSVLAGYLEQEAIYRREEIKLRRQEMEIRREQHTQVCGAITGLTAAVTEMNALLRSFQEDG